MSGRKVDCPRCYRPGAEHIIGNYIQCWHCDQPKAKAPVIPEDNKGLYICDNCQGEATYLIEYVAYGGTCPARSLFYYGTCKGKLVRKNQ